MKRNIFKTILLSACILQGGSALAQQEKAEPGKFSPTWESLSQYEVPEWFRNAKFGIWAHWGPQCQPEAGDWYGRGMYEEGGAAYKWHLEHYGPSFGIRLQGCNQRMESRKMESGEAGSPFQENRCPIFLCYGQPSRQHGLVGQ